MNSGCHLSPSSAHFDHFASSAPSPFSRPGRRGSPAEQPPPPPLVLQPPPPLPPRSPPHPPKCGVRGSCHTTERLCAHSHPHGVRLPPRWLSSPSRPSTTRPGQAPAPNGPTVKCSKYSRFGWNVFLQRKKRRPTPTIIFCKRLQKISRMENENKI